MEKFKKILDFLTKNQAIIVVFLLLIVLIGNCNKKGRDKDLMIQNDSLKIQNINIQKEIDSIKKYFVDKNELEFVDKNELEIMLAIERYKVSYNVVYDNNTIVRTTKRPDDVMNKYNKEIDNLNDKLEKYRENKVKK